MFNRCKVLWKACTYIIHFVAEALRKPISCTVLDVTSESFPHILYSLDRYFLFKHAFATAGLPSEEHLDVDSSRNYGVRILWIYRDSESITKSRSMLDLPL